MNATTESERRGDAGREARFAQVLDRGGFTLRPESHAASGAADWAMAHAPSGARLLVVPVVSRADLLADFDGERGEHDGAPFLVGPTTARNAAALRRHLTWLEPRLLPSGTSAGFGDRLGLATFGHVRALRAAGGSIAPVFAQQSIREMTRTARSPQSVIDDATWGSFEAGWQGGQGADADHLKTPGDITACADAGFTMYTIDPGEHVSRDADTAAPGELRAAWDALPWDKLEDSPASMRARLAGRAFDLDGQSVHLDEAALVKAAVKYGRAVAHVTGMFRHLATVRSGRPFDLEVSVDETDTPTTPADHIFVASELRRLGVRWASLAPRFIGRFEKGVDYIGDLEAFDADMRVHAAIARAFGPYKLSLHSGSDKFSIYETAARHTRGRIHVKTAGTSYLEALRAIAMVAPDLFRSVYAFALSRYEEDRASYHVSASLALAPDADGVPAGDVAALLEHFHVRQILHVTFGSVLTAKHADGRPVFADSMRSTLQAHPEVYAGCLERHFVRHLRPFAGR
ncbi:MAG: tagaturonate epimerase family protein [Vicinamibacterales bacterium]